MTFKIKKIRQKPETTRPKLFRQSNRKLTISIPLISFLAIIIFLSIGIVKAFKSIDLSVFLKVAGEDLRQDGYGHTNFLLLGNGGKNHDGGDLMDTIIVASLDQENKLITMMSVPRDLYVKDSTVGNSRINEVYFNANKKFGSSTQGLDYMKSKVEEIVGIPIHYWVKIDFSGFKELIDALGGIDIEVKTAIYDPYYPKDGTYLYETFSLSAGQHHLDGTTALKYARSRKTTSDFDRADRQQEILYAIKQKALQTEVLLSAEKITKILNTLKSNIETNIKVKEILTLGSIAKNYTPDQISHRLVHDDPTQCGGFLYTPSMDAYGGMYVLIPAGGFEMLHLYSDNTFNNPYIAKENLKIHILNGTKKGGVAGETKQILKRYCFDITRFGNAPKQDIATTTYYYRQKTDSEGNVIENRPKSLDFLQKLIPGKESTKIPQEYIENGYIDSADIILELGQDYVNSPNYVEDPFYSLPIFAPTPAPTTETATPTTTEPTTNANQ